MQFKYKWSVIKITTSSTALISSDTPYPGATITFIILFEFSNS